MFQNKKAMIKETIVMTLILSTSFILIFFIVPTFISKAEAKSSESICRGSAVLREQARIEQEVLGHKFGITRFPLLCKTLDKEVPQDPQSTKEEVMGEIADLMARCWWQFGEGKIEDPFKEGNFNKKNCFVCYTVATKKTKNFKEEISSKDFFEYLFNTPYKIIEETDRCKIGDGFCTDTENNCKFDSRGPVDYWKYEKDNKICKELDKGGCCYSNYDCLNKGGFCKEDSFNDKKYKKYDKWKCPEKLTCFIKEDNLVSYGDYIQEGGGNVRVLLFKEDGENTMADVGIRPSEEVYAISFGSPTEKCDVCTTVAKTLGVATGVLVSGYLVVQTGGTILIPLFAGSIAGTATGAAASITLEGGAELLSKIWERDANTIYLTTLTNIEKECNIIEDIASK